MSQSFTVAISACSEELQDRIRRELAATNDASGVDVAERRICIVTEDWRDELASLPTDSARIAVVAAPDAPELTAALANGELHAVIGADFRDGQLETACVRAWDHYRTHEKLEGEAARGERYLKAIGVLSGLGVELGSFNTRSEILRRMAETACELSGGDLCAIVLVDRRDPPLLHIHSERACDDSLLVAVQNRCIESYMRLTGRALDESQLVPQITGGPIGAAADSALPASSLELPLRAEGVTVGVLLASAQERNRLDMGCRSILKLASQRSTDALRHLRTRRFEERRRLGLMVESMADGLIMTELERDQVLINSAARRLLEIDEGAEVTQLYLKERLGFYPFDLVAANPDSNELLREELTIGERRLHSMVSPVRERSGAVIGVVVVLRDFTEAHALAHRQEEFVSIVSHELRSPLTSISGALDIALSDYAGRLNDKQRKYLSLARESCTSLNQIVDDLLDVARSESGGMTMHIGPVDLSELTAKAIEKFRGSAASKHIRMQFKSSERDLRIAGDPDRLTQVLNNLLSNALKFTPIKGNIEIEDFGPSVTSSHVGVSVYNDGETIADEAKERIFEKFEQAKSSSTRRVGGSGLGLAISRSIVEAHGGRIWVESGGERGAKFVFTLPAAHEESGAHETVASEFDSKLSSAPRSGKAVLLIDGDRHSSYILKGILMSAGHDVHVASDVDGALTEARKHLPPLIVVNAGTSQTDPLPLIQILKHDSETRKSAILVLAFEDGEDAALRGAAANIVPLPIVPEVFLRECTRLLQEAGAAHASRVLVVDDDPAIRTICVEVLRQAGLTVRQAANGIAALSEAKRFRPDLLLLDIMMPDLDGFQTAEHFKSDPATAMTPIIFLSAMGETSNKVKAFQIGAEDYVVKPFVAAEMVARVRKALERSHRELGASPTTQLPGGRAIETEIEQRLSDRNAAFCYLDLDNLKAYNDYYSYAKADSIIRQTGDLIRDVIARHGSPGDFIGHIAGDDFVFITSQEYVDDICSTLCGAFDRLVPLYYDKSDRDAGFIEAKDRYDELRRFPLMSVSIAAITSHKLTSYSQLAAAAAAGKKLAKALEGSCYVRDGKTIWSSETPDR